MIASFLASPAGSAVGIRRAVAPTLRDRPGVVWSIFGALALHRRDHLAAERVAPVGPHPAADRAGGVWLEEVRRKTAREFPGAKKGDWMKSMRKRAREARPARPGRRIGSAVRELTDDDGEHPDDAKLERLEKLGELKEKGVLTAAEFREEKKKILSG